MELPIPGFPKYYATIDGEIISYRRGKRRIMKQSNSKGYLVVTLFDEYSNNFRRYVHQCVLEANGFFRSIEKNQVRHKDNNRTNNTLENLEWATQIVNQSDRLKAGTDVSTIRSQRYWSNVQKPGTGSVPIHLN